jgi:hypothetical protein
MLGLYREEYADFTVKHFHEQLQKRHGYVLGYTVTRLALQTAGLVKPAPRRSAHRKKRPRRPLPGMMLHQDASRFAWVPDDAHQYDLVVTLDDATSEIYSAFLVEEEGTASTFRALAEVIATKGLFCARNSLAIQEERRVGNDNTVKWRRLSLQLPPSRLRPHFVRAKVRVHEYPDATIAVFLGPHRLADYDQNGRLLEPRVQAA